VTARRAPWTDRILELLADGEWHTYDELAAAAGPLVPPGHARRTAERNRRSNARTGHSSEHGRVRPADELAVGRRHIVVAAIRSLTRSSKVEARDGRVRVPPGRHNALRDDIAAMLRRDLALAADTAEMAANRCVHLVVLHRLLPETPR
jgi:hypothetical protein